MNAVEKALWFIESHFAGEITLEDIAKAVGVSRFHMTRAFGTATGHSIMRYVRSRRLLKRQKLYHAVHRIRAFRDEFGVTPEMIRTQASLKKIEVVGPIKMDEMLLIKLEPPRLKNGRRLLIAGIGARTRARRAPAYPRNGNGFYPIWTTILGRSVARLTAYPATATTLAALITCAVLKRRIF